MLAGPALASTIKFGHELASFEYRTSHRNGIPKHAMVCDIIIRGTKERGATIFYGVLTFYQPSVNSDNLYSN